MLEQRDIQLTNKEENVDLFPYTKDYLITCRNGKTLDAMLEIHMHAISSPSNNGFMSAQDKLKLNNIEANANFYHHPDSHPASIILQDETHRFVSDENMITWNDKYTKKEVDDKIQAVAPSDKGVLYITSITKDAYALDEEKQEYKATITHDLGVLDFVIDLYNLTDNVSMLNSYELIDNNSFYVFSSEPCDTKVVLSTLAPNKLIRTNVAVHTHNASEIQYKDGKLDVYLDKIPELYYTKEVSDNKYSPSSVSSEVEALKIELEKIKEQIASGGGGGSEMTGCPFPIGALFYTESDNPPDFIWDNTQWEKIENAYIVATGNEFNTNAGMVEGTFEFELHEENLPAHTHDIKMASQTLNVAMDQHRHSAKDSMFLMATGLVSNPGTSDCVAYIPSNQAAMLNLSDGYYDDIKIYNGSQVKTIDVDWISNIKTNKDSDYATANGSVIIPTYDGVTEAKGNNTSVRYKPKYRTVHVWKRIM